MTVFKSRHTRENYVYTRLYDEETTLIYIYLVNSSRYVGTSTIIRARFVFDRD